MAKHALDKLLTTLDVDLHAFAVCNVAVDARLVFQPMNVVVVHYVLSGSGFLEVRGSDPVGFDPGTILIVPPNLGQSLVVDPDNAVDVDADDHCSMEIDGLIKFDAAHGKLGAIMTICATINATFGGSFGLFDNLGRAVVEDVRNLPAARSAFGQLIAERAAPDIGTHAISEALMKQSLILMIRHQVRDGAPGGSFFGLTIDPRLLATVADVLRRPAAPTSLTKLSAAAGMSRSTFSTAFKNAFGQSPMDFVQKTRLHHAAGLLASTDLPIKVIAGSTGFASRSHFSRAFRTAYASDPSAYRSARFNTGDDPPANDGRDWLTRMIKPTEDDETPDR